MSQEPEENNDQKYTELPIEKGFPIEKVNQLVEKEGMAQMWYRPIYTMHKWWARRLGCVFRSISIYSLIDGDSEVNIKQPGENDTLTNYTDSDITSLIDDVSPENPESLWELYNKDVTVENKTILDPFMGGGTSMVESSRLGSKTVGNDLNPVAWFVTKKELEAGDTDPSVLEDQFNKIKEDISEELKSNYKTKCPNSNGDHLADVICYMWVKELNCTSCEHTVSLFNDYRVGKGRYNNKGKYNVLCPECESIVLIDGWRDKSTCSDCGHNFVAKNGNSSRGNYSCPDCGQKYGITDAIQEQDGFETRLYALEYHCPTCEDNGYERSETKGYKSISDFDRQKFRSAKEEWAENPELQDYIPQEPIRSGWKTSSSKFDGNAPGAGDIEPYGYKYWKEMYNERQLLCLSKLLRRIDQIENQNHKEFLLLAFSDALRMNSMFSVYQAANNQSNQIFKTNSFDPPQQSVEGNVWGAEFGTGTFRSIWDKLLSGVEYANAPTERYFENDEVVESKPFSTSVGQDFDLECGDVRDLTYTDEFDAIITDPPYYDNVIYSELSDFFYVWQKIILESEYEHFQESHTPRAESIVSNPAEKKTKADFESELREAFSVMKDSLKNDGVLVFTYHHSDSDSWGELLEALCDESFVVTATYPISADIRKFTKEEAVSFDIIVVARPFDQGEPISWNALRRDIYRTARRTRRRLEENRDLSRGDIGVMEMGECFREYSEHHGHVQRDGEVMSAKEVVDEIYGIIQEASDIGVIDVFVDLLDTETPSYDDVNKLCRGTNATPDDLKETRLYIQEESFAVGTWDNEKRQAYIQERVNGNQDEYLSDLDKLQFLRYRYEKGQSVQNYIEKWGVDDELRELAARLADVTEDSTYTRVLGDRDITNY